MAEKLDPWGSAKIEDYEHVFEEFGLKRFSHYDLTEHYLLRRKIIIAERDFDKVADAIRNRKKFLQLTGIASSGDLHFGHKLDIDLFLLFKRLGAKSKFCVCDIDGYVSRPDAKVPSMEYAKEVAVRNTADALALGLEPSDIYVQSRKEPEYYQFAFEVSKEITSSTFEAIYGHTDLGKACAVLLQIADILHVQLPFMFGKAPSITGIGLDQDPHARITRDIAKKVNYTLEMPSFFYFIHQGGLKEGSKMSSSDPDTAIFLKDSPAEVKKKMNRAFTGGKDSVEEQRETGGNPDACKVFEMLRFHHPDDNYLIGKEAECRSGKILCGQCKQECIRFVQQLLAEHQKRYTAALPLAKEIVYGK